MGFGMSKRGEEKRRGRRGMNGIQVLHCICENGIMKAIKLFKMRGEWDKKELLIK
jgi:hypothetical protein